MKTWRSRLGVGVVVIGLGTLFLLELPIRELVHQRAEIANASTELSALTTQNRQLNSTISSLRENSVISAIAHAEYGLVLSGQRSYVVLPGSESVAGAANTLQTSAIPLSDLVSDNVTTFNRPGSSATSSTRSDGQGLFARTVSHLEFWRWAF